jgi:hypothetical protein
MAPIKLKLLRKTNMKNEPRIQETTGNETKIANGKADKLTEAQAAAIKEFVEQLGGIENARRAVAALKELKKAA